MAEPSSNNIRVKLARPGTVFRDRSGYHLTGNQVVEITDDPIPPGVAAALHSGRLVHTKEEPQDNTSGPTRPAAALPRLAPHYRGRAEAIIPNFDVSTTAYGGTTADAGNHGVTGINSAHGREKHGDEASEAARAINQEQMVQQYGFIPPAEQDQLVAQLQSENAALRSQLEAARTGRPGKKTPSLAAPETDPNATGDPNQAAPETPNPGAPVVTETPAGGTRGNGH